LPQGEELLIDYGEGFWKTMYCGIMRAHTEAYRYMQPWCSRMKQMLEEKNVDQPPKPDFTRSLPPLLMDTVDICSPAAENDEKFTVKCRTLLCSAGRRWLRRHARVTRSACLSHCALQRFDDTSDDEEEEEATGHDAGAAQVQAGGAI
jgi:hypothetical protein